MSPSCMDLPDLFPRVTPRALSPSEPEASLNANMAPAAPDDTRPPPRPEELIDHASSTATGGDGSARSEFPLEATVQGAKGKTKARKGPLRLLDLPVDILKEIIHQLPHTNDLTSLALCHSALHRLTIPYIYSRFDIVWPDESNHPDPGKGVDALTFGLATLVMGWDTFPHQARRGLSPVGGGTPRIEPDQSDDPEALYPLPRMRFGNYYAQYTKKFSLGNGPPMWVQEYIISKESGKMLGTLVAMAVARMINLETFIWDMPTGVLSDVWRALSSLAYRTDGQECRLERLWVRWHDNTIDSPAPPPAPPLIVNNLPPPPNTTHPSGMGTLQMAGPIPPSSTTASAVDRVEHPTFSVIPALKSLSVLDIDELPYLDEMSILIARSQRKLRELRVGIAPHAQDREWVTAWEGPGIQQVDYSTTSTAACSISEKRLGGVLGILVGRVHNMRHSEQQPTDRRDAVELAPASATTPMKDGFAAPVSVPSQDAQLDRDSDSTDDSFESASDEPLRAGNEPPSESERKSNQQHILSSLPNEQSDHSRVGGGRQVIASPNQRMLTGKLNLEVLELERVPVSVSVLLKAFNWSTLTTLTLLNCNNHEQLWKALRREFTPRSAIPQGPASSTTAYKASYTLRHRSEYRLNIKKIHTNTVSPSLISFIKDALAPNTLEVLFLQEGRSYSGAVSIDAIYRGPLKRHRGSLKKLMIDSSERGPDGQPTNSLRWRRWVLNREIISFITSGRMTSLRELAFSIDYKDWHHFLQRLPQIPHLRSLYIPFIADHVHGNNLDPRELAMQVLDIVHLRPEIQLCYMGITTKCFEILETKPCANDLRHENMHDGPYATQDQLSSDDDESEVTEDDIEDDDFDDMPGAGGAGEETASETSDDGGQHEDSDDDSFLQDERKAPRLRIREILFYEEKIETLRARHGILKP
ncbi:uncharacterized protein EI97DRAFT_415221 [Westerdykella ornata]|uniref:F-box domain-containing protein n=1 Tax=Westerdykella ornata TaxID=318751 RepID=A0A6A6JU50_WESOR|nr:uncharacterized protein EI97DRAFT_415221 [Westerdykella ornata]KAF2278559.1 hypothetical protein EI97DRAFT_415221 [Westerdykella ornata]